MQMSRAKRRLSRPQDVYDSSLRRSKTAVWIVDDVAGLINVYLKGFDQPVVQPAV